MLILRRDWPFQTTRQGITITITIIVTINIDLTILILIAFILLLIITIIIQSTGGVSSDLLGLLHLCPRCCWGGCWYHIMVYDGYHVLSYHGHDGYHDTPHLPLLLPEWSPVSYDIVSYLIV